MKKNKNIISKLILVCICFLVTLLFAELFLRFATDLLPMNFQNIVLQKYNRRADGIYYWDHEWNMTIIKPNFQQEMFANGYRWHHQSNEIGIRDDRNIEKAEIVVLGDSFIYGNGVEKEDTFSHYLEEISGKTVANLGVQADYPPNQYIRLKLLVLLLQHYNVLSWI